MDSIGTLLTVVLVMFGFGLIPLLGILLPHEPPQDIEEDDEHH